MAPPTPATLTPDAAAGAMKRRAAELGFDTAGITDLAPTPHAAALDAWLTAGHAGGMGYMHRQAARRREPEHILPGATHALVLTRNYHRPQVEPADGGRVAQYACGPDYHKLLTEPLDQLVDHAVALGASPTATRAFVDAGPVPERELAQRAGLGWIGKNTMLIAPDRGSYFFLATVLTDLALAIDLPFEADRCGSCTRCLEACPTGAFPAPRVLDATRCISYGTIEHRGSLPDTIAAGIGDWIFGCDVCQDVCPWNSKFAREEGSLFGSEEMGSIPLETFDDMTQDEFDRRFGWTPLERPGLEGMRRNCDAVRRSST